MLGEVEGYAGRDGCDYALGEDEGDIDDNLEGNLHVPVLVL